MQSFGSALRQSREAAGLSVAEFARLSGIPPAELSGWEDGQAADPKSMEQCALVMGVRLGDFLNGEASVADAALLFRRASPDSGREQVLALDAGLGLSRFCRTVYELADLRKLLGRPLGVLPDLSRLYEARPRGIGSHPGDHLALAARRALSIDATVPIESMRVVLDSLGIPLVISAQGEVDSRISGASVLHPIPAVLLVPAWSSPWVTRMTLAHELCHVLFHRAGLSVSPDAAEAPQSWMLDADYVAREQEANAFAAAFLAPAHAIRQLLQGVRPDSEQGVRRVGSHFRVGKRVAVNRIVDTYGLTETRRQALLSMNVIWPTTDKDSVSEEDLGLLQGQVHALTIEALERGLISKTRARSILGVPDGEPLESAALSGDRGAPVLSQSQMIARQCQVELWKKGHEFLAEEVEADGADFRVSLADTRGERIGYVSVDQDGNLLSAPVFE